MQEQKNKKQDQIPLSSFSGNWFLYSCSVAPLPLLDPVKRRCCWRYASIKQEDYRLLSFSMEWLLLPYQSSICLCSANIGGNSSRRHAFHTHILIIKPVSFRSTRLALVLAEIEEPTHRRYCSHPSPKTHAPNINSRNHANSGLQHD